MEQKFIKPMLITTLVFAFISIAHIVNLGFSRVFGKAYVHSHETLRVHYRNYSTQDRIQLTRLSYEDLLRRKVHEILK